MRKVTDVGSEKTCRSAGVRLFGSGGGCSVHRDTRVSCDSCSPMWKSMPRRSATSSLKNRPGDLPDDLADQEAEGKPVVSVLQARSPEGSFGSKCRGHQVPVIERARRERLAQGGEPRLVVEQHADGNPVLSALSELRPVRCY